MSSMLDLDYLQKVLDSYQLDLLQEPGLDKNRLQKIIKSAGLDLSGRPLTNNKEDEGRCYWFWTTIGRALEFWESDFSTFLDILEKEDLDTVIENDWLLNYLQDYAPLFSLRELETITESLIRHQEANRESLIAHGYPTSSFEDSGWHSKLLSNLYYLALSPEKERQYSNLFSNFPEEEVAQTLSEKEIDQLKLIRPKLFDLKILILRHLKRTLFETDAEGLLINCLRFIEKALGPDEIEFCLWLDQHYTGPRSITIELTDEYTTGLVNKALRPRPGGLTDLLLAVGHYQKEHTIGTLTHTREALGYLLESDHRLEYLSFIGPGTGDPEIIDWMNRVNTDEDRAMGEEGSLSQAVALFGPLNREKVEKALDEFREREGEEQRFWKTFRHEVKSFVSRKSTDGELIRTIASQFQAAAHPTSYSSVHLEQEREDEVLSRFPAPEGLKWAEVSMTFVSDQSLQIKARSITKTYHFAEIGFKDQRALEKPTKLWDLLKGFAQFHGEISWEDWVSPQKVDLYDRNRLQANVKRLRKQLKLIMGLEENPFYDYKQAHAYKTRFSIRDETLKR